MFILVDTFARESLWKFHKRIEPLEREINILFLYL